MYRGRLQRDLALWVEKGLLDSRTAASLLAEVDSRGARFSAGHVLLIIASVLVSAAILLLVAANWEAIGRPARIIGVLLLIWLFHMGAAFALWRGLRSIGQALLVLGAATFGGAMSLVGQMYHLSGDLVDMMIVWFGITCFVALLFRSGALAGFAGLLAWAFFVAFVDEYDWLWHVVYAWVVPLMAIIVVALARFSGTLRVRHLGYLLMLGWLVWLYSLRPEAETALALAVAGVLAFLAVSLRASPLYDIVSRTGSGAPAAYGFLLTALGIGLLHFNYDEGVPMALLSVATLAAVVLALALNGRDNSAVRYFAYAVFAAEILYLSFRTIDSMLSTSGFFLISGVVVAILAWVVIRLEKRFASQSAEVAS